MWKKLKLINGVLILIFVAGMAATAMAEAPAISVQGLDGQSHSLDALREGRPTVLIFWATWCGHCRAEIPRIKEAWNRFGKSGVKVLAIDPGIRDSLAKVQRYVKKYDLDYPVFFDSHQQSRTAFGLRGTPTIILLDATGKEVSRSESVDLKAIEKLLH